jgi:hypothetical protein
MNSEMPKDIKKWETMRQKGKTKFILLNGVVAWGIPMFVIMTFVINRERARTKPAWLLLVSAVIWAIGGACFGLAIWTISEKKYQRYTAAKNPNEIK